VKESINNLNQRLPNTDPEKIDPYEERLLLEVLGKCRREYESKIQEIAPFINSVAAYIPQRRARKLHIGLFGYSRCVAGVCLPRAISFAAALYSIGLPPEFIGMKALNQLNEKEWNLIEKYYLKMKHDLNLVGEYVSWKNINTLIEMSKKVSQIANMNMEKLKSSLTSISNDLKTVENKLGVKLGPKGISQRKHENFTNNFLLSYMQREEAEAKKALFESAKLRKCLG
jgi:phosphoenolpyruvate carboxylase